MALPGVCPNSRLQGERELDGPGLGQVTSLAQSAVVGYVYVCEGTSVNCWLQLRARRGWQGGSSSQRKRLIVPWAGSPEVPITLGFGKKAH